MFHTILHAENTNKRILSFLNRLFIQILLELEVPGGLFFDSCILIMQWFTCILILFIFLHTFDAS